MFLKTLSAFSLTFVAPMTEAQDISQMQWDDVVLQAQKEGEVTWYVWYLEDDLRRFVQSFESDYGIKVTIPEGTEGGNINKLLAERARIRGDIDLFAGGGEQP